jgi:hypothetical protein
VGKKLDILESAILNKSSQESHTSPVSRTQTYATSCQVVVELKESLSRLRKIQAKQANASGNELECFDSNVIVSDLADEVRLNVS